MKYFEIVADPTRFCTCTNIQLEQWQGQNFLVSPAAEREGSSRAAWILNLVSVRDKSPLLLKLEGSVMTVATPHMSVAADVIQSLANFFNLSSLQSLAEFPAIFSSLKDQLSKIEELQQNSAKITATIADTANLIRGLIVQAEDSRLLMVMKDLRECYSQLQQVNSELMRSYALRNANHNEILTTLRNINNIIQHAARLRVGREKNEIAQQCRLAVANNNVNALIKIIKTGEV